MKKMKKNSTIRLEVSSKKLEAAKGDFDEMMKQVKPFIKKSNIILTSTDGKWFDTTTMIENVIYKDSQYQ